MPEITSPKKDQPVTGKKEEREKSRNGKGLWRIHLATGSHFGTVGGEREKREICLIPSGEGTRTSTDEQGGDQVDVTGYNFM